MTHLTPVLHHQRDKTRFLHLATVEISEWATHLLLSDVDKVTQIYLTDFDYLKKEKPDILCFCFLDN